MIRSWTLARGLAAVLLAGSLVVADLSAQRGPPPQGPGNRPELERRVRARFAEMMKQRLGLSEEQSALLGRTVESFMEQRQRLVADEQALRRRTEAVMLEQAPSEEEARSLLARMLDLREQELQLFRVEQDSLLKVLTPVQLVRFHAMREQLGQRIQQLRGGMGPGGVGRPPGGGGFPGTEWPDTTWEH